MKQEFPTTIAVLDQFEQMLPELWRWSGMTVNSPLTTANSLRKFIELEGPTSPGAAEMLEVSGIRAQWNDAFANQRSSRLADWFVPFIDGPLLDVLAGDLSVTGKLADQGILPIVATERFQDYETFLFHKNVKLISHRDEGSLVDEAFNSVLVCTVLHHEPDPVRLLQRLDCVNAKRWIVVENCLESNFKKDFHEFVDLFFNNCLNKIGIPCVNEHRTPTEWRRMLSEFGQVVHEDLKSDVPGIPFPYRMFVVDKSA